MTKSYKPVDTSKKSNIKCEHCEYWNGKWDAQSFVNYSGDTCRCAESVKYGKTTNYWNRCKSFQWANKYVLSGGKS